MAPSGPVAPPVSALSSDNYGGLKALQSLPADPLADTLGWIEITTCVKVVMFYEQNTARLLKQSYFDVLEYVWVQAGHKGPTRSAPVGSCEHFRSTVSQLCGNICMH